MILTKQGLGVDLDETLSNTAWHWVEEMQKLFGNPENLSVKEMIDKYEYTQNIPYWQTKEAWKWMDEKIHSNEFHKDLPIIENSNHFLNKISKIIPIAAYITMRPTSVEEGTKHWLKKHGFPDAPIISKPVDVPIGGRSKWKAKVIEELYPKIVGIIDDSPSLVEAFSDSYKGIVFFYNRNKSNKKLNIIQCKDWETIYNEVKKAFK